MTFHPSAEMLDAVEDWRQRRPGERVRRALVPLLRERFGIGPAEAVEVIRRSHGGANAEAS